jgi:hypothetical protein
LPTRPATTTATGFAALGGNALAAGTGDNNTANGFNALASNATGVANTAVGAFALASNTENGNNTAVGVGALGNSTGGINTAFGINAGANLTTGSFNIYIGNQGVDESNAIRIGDVQTATFIAGISGTAVVGDPVVVDANGQLGTAASSQRFKDAINPMDRVSEAILALKPVTFHYKKQLDPRGIPQFGLVAEEVAKVNPDLVVRDRNGEIYSVRYEAVNAMLLNEFLKAHRKVQEQETTIAQLKSGMEALSATVKEQAAQIQKVSDKVEMNRPSLQTVVSDR